MCVRGERGSVLRMRVRVRSRHALPLPPGQLLLEAIARRGARLGRVRAGRMMRAMHYTRHTLRIRCASRLSSDSSMSRIFVMVIAFSDLGADCAPATLLGGGCEGGGGGAVAFFLPKPNRLLIPLHARALRERQAVLGLWLRPSKDRGGNKQKIQAHHGKSEGRGL